MLESIGAQFESQELAPHSALQRNFRKREEKMLLGLGTLRHTHCFVVNIALGIIIYTPSFSFTSSLMGRSAATLASQMLFRHKEINHFAHRDLSCFGQVRM
jgi:hypothetical protein